MIVSFLPIFLSGVASVIIGFIWYHPSVFGTAFMRMSGMTPEMRESGMKKMPLMAFIAFLSSMLVAYVMSYFGIAWGVVDSFGAVQLAFWCWLGFTAPPMLGMVLWEGKPLKHYLIISLNWLVSMIAMALIIVSMTVYVGIGAGAVDTNASANSSAE